MNIQDFTYLIQHPKEINKEQTIQLEDVLIAYPYFQSARALHLKGLKNQDSFRYNQTLKKTAAHTTDRKVLFDFITSFVFIDDEKETTNKEVETITEKNITKPKEQEKVERSKETLKIGKPLTFEKNESHSFNEWLQLSSIKPIKRKEKKGVLKRKFDLVDKFIANNPKIKPVKKTDSSQSSIKQETTDYNTLMTETLARVYLEQKKYKNAIKAYRILSLKYPEKSSYFALQIKAIKTLDKK